MSISKTNAVAYSHFSLNHILQWAESFPDLTEEDLEYMGEMRRLIDGLSPIVAQATEENADDARLDEIFAANPLSEDLVKDVMSRLEAFKDRIFDRKLHKRLASLTS